MSMDPGTMQAMLAMGLQGGQGQSVGGQQPQTSPLGAGAQLVQKIMLMRALQGQQPPKPPAPGPIAQANPALQQVNPMAPATAVPGMQNV